jgi:hypothetical protein
MFYFNLLPHRWYNAGVDPGFQVRGGTLKKIAPSRGRRENVWGISCEKSWFPPGSAPAIVCVINTTQYLFCSRISEKSVQRETLNKKCLKIPKWVIRSYTGKTSGQTTQWPKEKGEKNKQLFTKYYTEN